VIALIAVAIREAVDTKIRSDRDVEGLLSVPVLASIGTIPRGARVVSYGRRDAVFADAFALLATQISPEALPRERGHVLAVTSALPNEGKTTTSINLAIALARRGQRVILADFDFRKATLAGVFDVPATASGVLEVLDGIHGVDDALWTVSLEGEGPVLSHNGDHPSTGRGKLQLLPAGVSTGPRHTSAPSDLAWLVTQLRARADVIVLDTPAALLTVEMSEVARLTDQVLVVVRQGHVTHRSLRLLHRQSRGWEASIAGAVLTDATTEASGYGYGYAYGWS
jgi:Mrp family chromosome partitioning ATPase